MWALKISFEGWFVSEATTVLCLVLLEQVPIMLQISTNAAEDDSF